MIFVMVKVSISTNQESKSMSGTLLRSYFRCFVGTYSGHRAYVLHNEKEHS